jgi:hypothetical protein
MNPCFPWRKMEEEWKKHIFHVFCRCTNADGDVCTHFWLWSIAENMAVLGSTNLEHYCLYFLSNVGLDLSIAG